MFYTYAHTKPDGTIFYIGKGTGKRAWAKSNHNSHWHNIVTKHKKYNIEILGEFEKEEFAFKEEILLIDYFSKFGTLCNKTIGGEGFSGGMHTEETKQKIKKANSGSNCFWYGKKHSALSKKKMQQAKLNKYLGKNHGRFKGIIVATNIITKQVTQYCGISKLKTDGFNDSHVYACINGRAKTHKGHTFKRLEV